MSRTRTTNLRDHDPRTWYGPRLTEAMLLARGSIQDRPFGKTLGAIARRGVSGQLTAESDGGTYDVVIDGGYIVAASSPSVGDSATAIGLAADLVTPAHAETIERLLATTPAADELDVIATVAALSQADIHRLRRRVIAQRAARMIALQHGDFVLTSTAALPVFPNCDMHVGGVIYQAARVYIDDLQLRAITSALGHRFELRPEVYDDLVYYGFGDVERPFLRALAAGVALETFAAMPDPTDRRIAQASLYALASCGAVYCETEDKLRLARGTKNPVRGQPQTISPNAVIGTEPPSKGSAEEAFHRGQAALRADRLDDAVFELELATQLAPNEPRYFAALAWAAFCRAPDKTAVAGKTRATLGRAIARSDTPVLPHYYLGMVERIMNRTEQALEHFREVLELQPNHQEAATEIRFLMRSRH